MVAIAQTGSGKTMGFLLPLLWECAAQRKAGRDTRGPLAFVLAPTRELAQQVVKLSTGAKPQRLHRARATAYSAVAFTTILPPTTTILNSKEKLTPAYAVFPHSSTI